MQNFKDLKVWEKSHQFTLDIYRITKSFPKEEMYGLTMQIRRASSSIAANIAEGCGRKTAADFAYFLNVALGSANEADYFLLLSRDLSYTVEADAALLVVKINEIKAMLITLISRVRKN